MQKYLNAEDIKSMEQALTREDHFAIFGKTCSLGRPRGDQLKNIVRRVKNTMFCGKHHILCVKLNNLGCEASDVDLKCYIPERPDDSTFTFVVPVRQTLQISIKKLIKDPTPSLHLYLREQGKTEVEYNLYKKDDNEIVLPFDELLLLDAEFYVDDDKSRDTYILRSEGGLPILTIHLQNYIPESSMSRSSPDEKPCAAEVALMKQILEKFQTDLTHPDTEDIASDISHRVENFKHIVQQLTESKKRKPSFTFMHDLDAMELLARLRAL